MGTFNPIDTKKLLLVSGKGGIGKSLVACSLGVVFSQVKNQRSLLVENSYSSQLFPLFGYPQKEDHHVQSDVEVMKDLFLANLDAKQCFKEYLVEHLGYERLYKRIFSHELVHTFLKTIPGLGEVMLLGRLLYSAKLKKKNYEKVIFDGPASGHFLKLISTPDTILNSGLGGPLLGEINKIRDLMADHDSTGVVWVTDGDDLAIKETLDFLPALIEQSPAQICAVIINRVLPSSKSEDYDLQNLPAHLNQYLSYMIDKQRFAAEILEDGLGKLRSEKHPLELIKIPELGQINEPLSLFQSQELWEGSIFEGSKNAGN